MKNMTDKARIRPEPFMRVLDILLIWVAAHLAGLARFDVSLSEVDSIHTALLYLSCGIAFLLFPTLGLYGSWRGRLVKSMLPQIFLAWTTVLVIGLLASFLLHRSAFISRAWVGIWCILTLFLLTTYRILLYRLLRYLRRRGYNIKNVIIIGYGNTGQEIHIRAVEYEWYGYHVKGIYCGHAGAKNFSKSDVEQLHSIGCIPKFILENKIDEVWITLPLSASVELYKIQYALRNALVDVRLIPDLLSVQILSSTVFTFLGMPALDLNRPRSDHVWGIAKSIFDKGFALMALIALSPLFIVITVGIKCTMPGPIIFTQRRIGLNGREFNLYKFRSMVVHDESSKVQQARKNDPRVTRLGSFLRKNSLDELPQFFNVLKGDMSIVGPRPHAVQHNVFYEHELETYMLRHRVKPGITGWAQIHGLRGETDTNEKMAMRVRYDLEYIRQWSFLMDIKIIIWTAIKGWQGNNAY
jgi:putative colanic acid biosynthesis UDP-glucose lipid carrier transferase